MHDERQIWHVQADAADTADAANVEDVVDAGSGGICGIYGRCSWRRTRAAITSSVKARQLSDTAFLCFSLLCRLIFLAGLAQG